MESDFTINLELPIWTEDEILNTRYQEDLGNNRILKIESLDPLYYVTVYDSDGNKLAEETSVGMLGVQSIYLKLKKQFLETC